MNWTINLASDFSIGVLLGCFVQGFVHIIVEVFRDKKIDKMIKLIQGERNGDKNKD